MRTPVGHPSATDGGDTIPTWCVLLAEGCYIHRVMSDASETGLVERWRSGDQEAADQLFQAHYQEIRRFFGSKTGRDVDELVQVTFLACLQSRERFRGECSFRTFLYAIARRQLYKYYRKARRDQVLDFSVTSLSALDTGPVTHAARNEEQARLMEAMCKLPLEQQLLLEMYYWESMKPKDLAQMFEIAEKTVHTRLFRAREALRKQVAADEAAKMASGK